MSLNLKQIKQLTQDFLEKMGFEAIMIQVSLAQSQNTIMINLKLSEPKALIGQKGENLLAFQHLLARILRRKAKEPIFLDLDVNDYKKRRINYIKDLTSRIADDVSLSKKVVILDPMRAYERRIIHLELAGRNDVVTESVGEEPERCVQIKPYP